MAPLLATLDSISMLALCYLNRPVLRGRYAHCSTGAFSFGGPQFEENREHYALISPLLISSCLRQRLVIRHNVKVFVTAGLVQILNPARFRLLEISPSEIKPPPLEKI